MMKTNLLLLLAGICVFGCKSEPQFEYFTSPDKDMIITLMRYDKRLYFTNGRYDRNKVPTSFISPIYGVENTYYCYIHWCGKEGAEILSPYGEWLDTEKDPQLKFRKINDEESNFIKESKSDEYVYCDGPVIY